ncbi:MAG: hypothetical protein JWR16_1711 [Nevskia sp.]|nr:hypothetical protein [Nevskia sp.]
MKAMLRRCCWLLLSLTCALPALADDIDLYNNPSANSLQPPYTIIVLDLNLLGICNSVLTQTSNPNNPDAPQLCLNITNTIILSDLLGGLTSNPTAFLTNLLVGTGTTDSGRAQALCNLYGLLGINSPVVALPGVGLVLQLLLGGVSTLTCGTLNFLLGIPLLSSILNPLLSGFVGQLISGLISPLLSTVVGQLPSAVMGLLQTTFSGVLNLGQTNLLSLLGSILQNLINTNVAIVISHADRSNATGSPGSTCSFADTASIPGARRTTVGCSNGAYFLLGFTPLADQSTINVVLNKVLTSLTNILSPTNLLNSTTALLSTALTTPTQLLPPYQGKEVYAEIAHYLAGNDIYNAPLARWDGLTGLLTRDTTIELSNGNYSKPALACRTANVLNVTLTNNIRDSESDATLRSYFPGLPATGAITLGNVVQQALNPGFVDNAGQRINLQSYFLIQSLLTSTSTLANSGATLLTYADSLGLLGLGQSVAQLMQPSLIVNASLASATTTSSAGTTTNGLLSPAFFSIFKPDANANTTQTAGTSKPGWFGNLKRLNLNQITNASSSAVGSSIYTDATCSDASAIAGSCTSAIASDGRIATTAKTYWTQTGQSKLGSASVDGREATLGGAGQNIPGYVYGGGGVPGRKNADGGRTLYYDSYGAPSVNNIPVLAGLTADDAVTPSSDFIQERKDLATSLDCPATSTPDPQCVQLMMYARGYDVGTSSAPKTDMTAVRSRSWMLGAVLHARPVAINYGGRTGYTKADPDIRVLFGSTDGYLRMLKNGPSAAPSGQEVWGFMPRAVMRNLNTLRDDAYSSPNHLGFPYGVDGAPAVLIKSVNSTTGVPAHVYAFFGLRRGGGSYYALDLSNPDVPSLMWVLNNTGVYSATYSTPGLISGSATQFTELGQTFSTPAIGKVLLQGETSARSVLIFGGGYNGSVNGTKLGKDLNNSRNATASAQVGVDDSVGNAIYMVDALTGELLWKAAKSSSSSASYSASSKTFSHPLLQDGIPSDVTAIDTDGDGYTDRAYVGDTGGHIWRVDLPITSTGADRSKWTLSLLASLGRHASPSSNNTLANDRRFFHAPDYVPARDPISNAVYDAVVIASGDREDPFNGSTLNDLYVLRDKDTISGKTLTDTTTVDGVITSETDSRLLIRSGTNGLTALPASCSGAASSCAVSGITNGWRLALSSSGEKATSAPITVGGTVLLSSFVPPSGANACVPSEGSAKLYGLSLDDGRPTIALFSADADGDSRSASAAAPGMPGEINGLTTSTLGVNAQTLDVQVVPFYRVYWRERRGDEEKPVPQ